MLGPSLQPQDCHKYLQPHDVHPIFNLSRGSLTTSRGTQAAILYCTAAGVSCQATHLIFDVDHRAAERIFGNVDVAKAKYTVKKDMATVRGGNGEVVEVDDVDIGKFTNETLDETDTGKNGGGSCREGGHHLCGFFVFHPSAPPRKHLDPDLSPSRIGSPWPAAT